MRKTALPIILLLLAFVFTFSSSLACPNDPNCNCDAVKAKKSKTCGLNCKDACLDEITVNKEVCGPDCTKPCCTAEEKFGNVWKTEDGAQHFICPVMKGEGLITEASSFSVVDGVKYFHCCPGCEEPFQANSARYLKDLALPENVKSVDANGLKHFLDPVNQEMGMVSEKTKFFDLDGKRYYFTSSKNMKKFKKKPNSFTS